MLSNAPTSVKIFSCGPKMQITVLFVGTFDVGKVVTAGVSFMTYIITPASSPLHDQQCRVSYFNYSMAKTLATLFRPKLQLFTCWSRLVMDEPLFSQSDRQLWLGLDTPYLFHLKGTYILVMTQSSLMQPTNHEKLRSTPPEMAPLFYFSPGWQAHMSNHHPSREYWPPHQWRQNGVTTPKP